MKQQTMSRLPSGNHNKSAFQRTHSERWKWSEEVLQTAMKHTGEGMWFGQIYLPLVLLFGTKKKKTHSLYYFFRQCATLKYQHVCVVYSSGIRQALICPSIFHTCSLMRKFQLSRAWIRLSLSKVWKFHHRSCEAWVKWDCHSKVSWDHIILLWYIVGKCLNISNVANQYVEY